MQLSRREVNTIAGSMIVSLFAGCSASGKSNGNNTTSTGSMIEVRLKGSDTDLRLFGPSDVSEVGDIKEVKGSQFTLDVTLRTEVASQISEEFLSMGVHENPDEFKISIQGKEQITEFGIGPAFADKVVGGEWDGKFILTFENRENAREVQNALS